jgi:hypothetical protein
MEKNKLLPVIAAIMIASMAVSMLSFSTTTVSASPEVTASIDRPTVKPGTYVLTITVTAGATAIDNVRITVPSVFENFAPTIKVFKDNVVTLEDNVVTLKAGTIVELRAGTLKLGADNVVKIPRGTKIRWMPIGDNVDALLTENLQAKITADFTYTVIDNVENVSLTVDRQVTLNPAYGTAKLLADTQVIRGTDNKVRLPENTTVALVTETFTTIAADNVVTLVKENFVLLGADNLIDPPTDNTGRNFTAVATATTNTIYSVSVNDNVLIWDQGAVAENIVLLAGTRLTLSSSFTVDVFENTNVVRAAGENVRMTAATATAAENKPKNWMQYDDTPDAYSVEWKGIGENRIAAGASLAFPFAVSIPTTAGGAQTILVRTKDINGTEEIKEVTLTVDNTPPTVTVAASPSWVKDNVAVTITVTASEKLAKLENVMVAENNAPENTRVIMTPTTADNTVWTGTYTTGDNVLRDGTAKIYVIGAQFEDLVGNPGSGVYENTFTVDRMKPPTPALTALTSFITENEALTPAPGLQVKKATWLIEGTAQDNFLGTNVTQEGMTVKIRVGTTVYTKTVDASGYFYQSITLAEGEQEVGVQYVDKAGNVGTENAENVTLDSTKPSVTMTSPADGAIINDNTPLFSLTIADATLGIENAAFDVTDNSGYTVYLRRDGDNAVLATLTPMNPQTIPGYFNSLTFENQWQLDNALPDNTYNIWVEVGDNLQNENVYFTFTIDTTKPAAAGITFAADYSGTTLVEPHVQKTTTLSLSGTIPTGEVGGTIKVYVDSVLATSVTTTTTAWSASITLTAGSTQKVEVSLTDVAGNESDKVLYGYFMADGSAPTVTISSPATGTATDKTSIQITGSVSKDTWEDYTELTVKIQVGGAAPGDVTLGADGSFTTSATLGEGTNVITITAKDAAGNVGSASITVERTVTPLTTYAIILVVVALILAAIAIFRREMK